MPNQKVKSQQARAAALPAGRSSSGRQSGECFSCSTAYLPLYDRATHTHIREIHVHLHLHFSNLLLAHLVSVYTALRHVPYACRLFLSHPSPSLPLFNATLKALFFSPAAAPNALSLFSLLRRRSLSPNRLSFNPLKAASFLPPLRPSAAPSTPSPLSPDSPPTLPLPSGSSKSIPVSTKWTPLIKRSMTCFKKMSLLIT